MKLDYVLMCQEKAQEKARKEKKVRKGNTKRTETIKGFIGLGAFLVIAGIVGTMDYNVEMAQAKASAKETVVSMSTVRRVYGVTMNNGSTVYAMENDGNIHSWHVEDASETDDYSPIQLVYDTMGTETMDDDEVVNVIPVEGNEITEEVSAFVDANIY